MSEWVPRFVSSPDVVRSFVRSFVVRRLFVIFCRSSFVVRWFVCLFVVRCLFVVCLFVVRRSSFFVLRCLCVVCALFVRCLFVVVRSSFVVRRLSFVVCRSSFVVVLSIVRRSSFVVCCCFVRRSSFVGCSLVARWLLVARCFFVCVQWSVRARSGGRCSVVGVGVVGFGCVPLSHRKISGCSSASSVGGSILLFAFSPCFKFLVRALINFC